MSTNKFVIWVNSELYMHVSHILGSSSGFVWRDQRFITAQAAPALRGADRSQSDMLHAPRHSMNDG